MAAVSPIEICRMNLIGLRRAVDGSVVLIRQV